MTDPSHPDALRLADQHHLRNTLAVIRAMARRTADEVDTVEDYAARLDGRLAAYIQVQSTTFRDGGADLEGMVADELLRFGQRLGDEADLSGPPVVITRSAAGLIAIVLHELAAAHVLGEGRDAPPSGLNVHWRRHPDGALTLTWSVALSDRTAWENGHWPAWLDNALSHQLGASIQPIEREGRIDIVLDLPPGCCRD